MARHRGQRRPLKVLLIHQAFVGPQEPGGTRHFEFARRLVAGGHQFTIVGGTVSYLTGRPTEAPGREQLEGVVVRRAYSCPALHRSYAWRVLSFLTFMWCSFWTAVRERDVDVVMGTSPPIFQALSAWLVAALKRRPLLLEIRDLWPEFAIDIGLLRSRPLIWIARRLEHFLYRRAARIVVNSPAYRDYLVDRGVPAAKISLIPNGVDASMFDRQVAADADRAAAAAADGGVEGPAEGDTLLGRQASRLRDELGLGDKFVVTYAGAIGMANDIDVLLEAAENTRREGRIHWLLVGDGKERPRLETEARRRGLDNLTFAGPRPKAEMPAVLAAADACVATLKDIPMFRTTYPNKVFDYMAAARPTILAIDGVIREVVEAAGGGIAVPPGDGAAIARAAEQLAADRPAALRMGAAAREHVLRHFDRGRHADQFAEVACRLRAA